MPNREICNFDNLVPALLAAKEALGEVPWWRGQARANWQLVPSVFRDREPRYEFNVAHRFVAKARTRHPNCPPDNDKSGWVFLMQHYRLPTRLLDWSESPLVALYFAVSERAFENEPGSLIALGAAALNHSQVNEHGLLGEGHPRVKPIFHSVWRPPDPRTIHPNVAIAAQEIDARMMMQLSMFTLHGNSTALDELPDCERFLYKLEIPADAKQLLRDALEFLAIHESNLFPDLEHLANELKDRPF